MLLIAICIGIDSKGGTIYKQERLGRHKKIFKLYKFRSMRKIVNDEMQLTVGQDSRITRVGAFIRKFKLDEIPQLWNILKGEMSFVGPRPEVQTFVDHYNKEQERVFQVRPGLTDPASLAFFNESALLAKQENPIEFYIQEIMPKKLEMNIAYMERSNFFSDLGLIFKTLARMFA